MTTLFDDLPMRGFDPARLPSLPPRERDGGARTVPVGQRPRGRCRDDDGAGSDWRAQREARAAALLEGLNPQQREAVLHAGPPLLIVAGAGSGKTRVLTHRIAHQLATGRVRASRGAGDHVHQQGRRRDARAGRRRWWARRRARCGSRRSTRRACGSCAARRQALGLRSSFSIYDAADSQRLLTLVTARARPRRQEVPRQGARRTRSRRSRTSWSDPEDVRGERRGDGLRRGRSPPSTRATRQRLRQAQRDGLRRPDRARPCALLQAYPAVAEHYRRRFRSILVDEYQDTNHAQYVLVRELTGHARAVRVDGAGRAASARSSPWWATPTSRSTRSAARRSATSRSSRRTTPTRARSCSSRTTARPRPSSRPRTPSSRATPAASPSGCGPTPAPAPQIVGYVADNEHEEARFVAEEIDRLGDSDGVRPGDVAIFYRTNAQSRALEEVLIRVGLPYKVVGGTRFYERREIKDAVAYLRAIANPDDDVNLRRVLNVPKRGIGDRSEAMVAAFAERRACRFGAALERADEAPGIGDARRSRSSSGFRDLMAGLRELADSGAGPRRCWARCSTAPATSPSCARATTRRTRSRVENLAELHAVATRVRAGRARRRPRRLPRAGLARRGLRPDPGRGRRRRRGRGRAAARTRVSSRS